MSLSEVKELNNKDYDYLVFQGCGGDLDEWETGIADLLKDNDIVPADFQFKEVYSFENGVANLVIRCDTLDPKEVCEALEEHGYKVLEYFVHK